MQTLSTCWRRMIRSAQRLIRNGWRDAEPTAIKLVAHSFIIGIAALFFIVYLFMVWGLIHLSDFLFGDMEYYVKAVCIIGELLLTLYIVLLIPPKMNEDI
jgi:hypothetical protein